MLSLTTLALFSAACLVLTATPGPDMALIASRSLSQGRAAGFATLAGIQAGTYCHALAAALGLSQLLAAAPLAFDLLRLAGAAYLLYLAWAALRAATASPLPADGAPRYPLARIFRQGLLTNLLNPKMALFVLALFPQFVQPEAGPVVLQMLLLATVLNLIGLLVNGVVIIGAGRLRLWVGHQRRGGRLPQYLLAGVYAGLALRLAAGGRN